MVVIIDYLFFYFSNKSLYFLLEFKSIKMVT